MFISKSKYQGIKAAYEDMAHEAIKTSRTLEKENWELKKENRELKKENMELKTELEVQIYDYEVLRSRYKAQRHQIHNLEEAREPNGSNAQ